LSYEGRNIGEHQRLRANAGYYTGPQWTALSQAKNGAVETAV
jgi:hypothetical protein